MKLPWLFLVSSLLLSTSSWANVKDGEKEALIRKKLESSSLYGENYQSLTFDGGWNSQSSQHSFRYVGKYDRTYAAWIDCFGDVCVGYYDNRTKESSLFPVVDDKKINLQNSVLAFSVTEKGELMLYVTDGECNTHSVISIYTSKNEDITSWKSDVWKPGVICRKMQTLSVGNRNYIGLLEKAQVSLWENKNGGFKKISQLKTESNVDLFKLQALSDSLYIAVNNQIYHADGTLKVKLADDLLIDDLLVLRNGVFSVSRSTDGLLVHWTNGTQKGVEKIKVTDVIGKPVFDADNPNAIYFCKLINGVSEIHEAVSKKRSKWEVNTVTENSPFNNRDIVVISNTPEETPLQFLWLQETLKDVKVNALSSVKMNIFQQKVKDPFSPKEIRIMMEKVADWQLGRSYIDKQKNDWHWGAFYMGLIAAYKATGAQRYWNEMMNVGQYFNWGLLPDFLHADRLLACDLYSFLYDTSKEKQTQTMMLAPTKVAIDLHTSRKAKIDVRFANSDYKLEWWSWADALFMAPASFYNYARLTGDNNSCDFAHKQWLAVQDYLYSKEDSLFFRDDRYFTERSTNGKKIFWARGNGWVMGALPRILEALPKGHKYRMHYETLFKTMAAKIKHIQMKEGLWTCSLLDPKELYIGESSGSSFFGYALAWGINNGLLERDEYKDCVMGAWKSLSDNVTDFGRLGYVQQIAGAPYPFYYHQYHTYASGGFLLFANEMIKLLN